jgi:hypothetical protein
LCRYTEDMEAVEWFGRGPHECYPDRKASAASGRYSSTVDDMHVPYIVPSENGGRADVSWVALQRAAPLASSTASSPGRRARNKAAAGPGLVISVAGEDVAQVGLYKFDPADP